MKSMKRGLAVLLAVLLVRPTLPVSAGAVETQPVNAEVTETQQDALSEYEVPLKGTDAGVSGEEAGGNAAGASGGTADGIQAPGDPGTEDGSTPGTEGDADAPGNPEEDPGTEDGSTPGTEGDADAPGNPEEDPGAGDGSTPGTEGDAEVPGNPEEGPGTEDGSTPGTEGDADAPGNPEEDPGTEDGSADTEAGDGSDGAGLPAEGSGAEGGADAEVPGSEDSAVVPGEGDGTGLVPEEAPEFGEPAVVFSTGGEYQLVVNPSASSEEGYEGYAGIFGADGSYTIQIPEEDPFFPYEVQFVDPQMEEARNVWFMTPDSTVEYGGHTFRVAANFTGNAVTQLSLNIAGDVVVIYPAAKEFGGTAPISLLPLEEKRLNQIDLRGYTPLDLTMVSVDTILAGQVDLKASDRITWTTSYSGGSNVTIDDFTVSQQGAIINLAYASRMQLIVGEPDQLAADNIRYTVEFVKDNYNGWLGPVFYTQDENGARSAVEVKRNYYSTSSSNNHGSKYEYAYESIYLSSLNGSVEEGYLGLVMDNAAYPNKKFTSVKAFEGWHESPQEAMAAADVTGQIFPGDMSQANTGYPMERYYDYEITLVAFDGQGNVTGCLPVELYYTNVSHGISPESLRTASGEYVQSYSSYRREEAGCMYYTYQLYKGVPVAEQYIHGFRYNHDGVQANEMVTAAYEGHYSSIASAQAAGAKDIKDKLFVTGYSNDGYGYLANYGAGINFTIFIGGDGTEGQQVLKCNVKVEASDNERPLGSGTNVNFYGLCGAGGRYVPSVVLVDSYAENNYVVFIVDDDADRSNLALDFSAYDGLKLYAPGSTSPETSRESFHDFSQGPMQFTASAEDGEHSKNYWIQVITKSAADGQLFINSLIDVNAKTETRDGVTYTTREVMLDSLHGYKHDILLANMGSGAIANLSAELVSDVVELDEYWTLSGKHELAGFTTVERTTNYGKLPNLAALRLRQKAGVEDGTEITGTLTLKSGSATLMVITLTGTVGDPSIITKEVPAAVKYVPYGTMIQNSNKYSWNTVKYWLWDGNLPEGMVIRPNGELYGVPTEVGEFTFTVRMKNSYSGFQDSYREFTLVVMENTNANVESQTDTDYMLTDRVTYDYNAGLGDQLMVSQGVYGEFVGLWLDGVKLTPGVDYTSESGSTRITIFSQTLAADKAEGTHTLGAEFRAAGDNTLKRAAQNYVLGGKSSFEEDNNNSGNGNNNNNGSNNGNGNNNGNHNSGGSSGSSSIGSGDVAIGTGSTTYTVQSGDTLWKIAVKFYGDGNQWRKIYEANKDVLKDPNKIYAGQVLKIVTDTVTGGAGQAPGVTEDGRYTVQPGDSLWKIAAKVYGNGHRWKKIYEANTDKISDASKIHVGQVLVIPE